MDILVINGSPKGNFSVTLQTVHYLEKLHPEHKFNILNIKIKSLEKNFDEAAALLEKAEVILFSYPVYTFLAPSQLHRFIELMGQSRVDFTGKYVSQITTSKHFYDMTAHMFIQQNCQDLGMKFIRGLSADMDDLLSQKGRRQAEQFFDFFCWSIETDHCEPAPAQTAPAAAVKPTVPEQSEKPEGRVIVIADLADDDVQLKMMIRRFQVVFPQKTRVINLQDFPFQGGCLGCFQCAADGKCVYKDGFDRFLRENIHTASAIVYAFRIRNHSMGYRFKLFDDRQFCEGHRTAISGKPVGYLISGNFSKEYNLQTVIEGRAQVESNFLAGIATDEENPDDAIDRMAEALDYGLLHGCIPPQNFYGVGGMKIFRDLVWQMQGLMRADHKYYREHGYYDFPQKHRGRMLGMYLVGMMMGNRKLQKKMGTKMNEGILMPYQKILDQIK